MAYADLLKDPRWQRKRLEMLNAAEWMCRLCFATEKTLHVHHKHYRRGAMPWEYSDSELEVLCENCHEAITETTRSLKEILESGNTDILFRVSAYAQAIAAKRDWKTPRTVTLHAEGQVHAIVDAFRDGIGYGMKLGFQEVLSRFPDRKVDLVALAKEEDDAMEALIQKHAEEYRRNK